jgi:mannose-6-phosphate isomerase-like protein (cupin superfamily)
MSDSERTRTRERVPASATPYDIFMRSRSEFLERQQVGQVLVRLEDREYFNTRQGKLLYYLNGDIHKNTPLQRHQGGLVIYVIEGEGYSVVDGERVDWKAGDLLLLPIKKGGVEHQHFNANPGSECHWVAFSYMPFFDHNASEFTQTEVSPLYKE